MRRLTVFAACASAALVVGLPVSASAATVAPAKGTVAGQIGYEGGAFPGGFHPTSGSVKIVAATASASKVLEVGNSGNFKVLLAPGKYTFIGCAQAHAVQCAQKGLWQKVTVKSGSTQSVQLVTFLAP